MQKGRIAPEDLGSKKTLDNKLVSKKPCEERYEYFCLMHQQNKALAPSCTDEWRLLASMQRKRNNQIVSILYDVIFQSLL